jgi:tetratricopeptide (TPR) repeat protein
LKEIGEFETSWRYLRRDLKLNKERDFELDHGLSIFNTYSLLRAEKRYEESNERAKEYLQVAKKYKEDRTNFDRALECFEQSEKSLRIARSVIPKFHLRFTIIKFFLK